MAPKGKKVTMSLNAFLKTDQIKEIGDESWADEGFSLPSAPRGMGELPSGPNGDSGFSSRRPGRFSEGGDRHQSNSSGGPVTIDQSRLPTCAPFTAFIGNLPFDIAEGDVRTFLQMRNIPANSILNVKLPRDNVENKSRGFGYVEFLSVDDLTRALLASNQFSIRNRVVRIDLSDSKPQTSDREIRPAESNRNWRDNVGSVRNPVTRQSSMPERESRPISVAESSRNWRESANPVEKSVSQIQSDENRRVSVPSSVPVSAASEPVRNWRDSAKPVEKKSADNRPEEKKQVPSAIQSAVPEQSKIPSGSWRR